MIALSGLSYFNRTIMSIAGPTVMKEFSISPADMGTVYSAFLHSHTILMSPGGWIADRFGQRAVLAVTGFGAALLTGLTSICGIPDSTRFWGFCRRSSCMAVTMRTKFVAV